ncbi:MAG TPA: glycosyltransferase family 39 protein, partial [Candidatus Limnocylindrales bacterium]|nr:glycosyltransferase family 39 protein [Candidatus Limnocylindrales bacterium]
MIAGRRRTDLLALLALLALAAALRFPNLATRGTWDADQGHDMLTLRSLVRDGVVPLLGPPTSIGDVHHGALYYYLLAPAAALTGGDSPLAVVALIALAGVAAVGVTWWLAGSIAGPIAGLVAGLAMAISPAAVDESTFIWNPNLIALSSAIALAGAWRAWTSRRARWWVLAAVGTAITMQCHVLGVTLLPVVGALLVADVRRRASPSERTAVIRAGSAGLAIIALSFLPLVIHELTTNFSEVQAALRYLRAGGDQTSLDPPLRLLVVASRVVSWPLVGLITAGFSAAVVSIAGVISLAAWRFRVATGQERVAVRWLALGLAWTALALTVISPSLSGVVEGLPNDHYHAFADPMVFVLVGIGAAALWTSGAPPKGAGRAVVAPGQLVVVAGVLAIALWAGFHQPPAIAPDGGFPAAEAAAARIQADAGGGPIQLVSLPAFKTAEAYDYPLVRGGGSMIEGPAPDFAAEGTLVVL